MSTAQSPSVGHLIREWRQRRRLSQLDLAVEAEISSKHLSFIETGRALPSRAMIMRLAEQLEVPLREQNMLLVAGGYAPAFPERSLDDPALRGARRAIDLVLTGHEPYPALAIDRHWTLIAANRAIVPLLAAVDPALTKPPINVIRLGLHPAGLAKQVMNYAEWRSHLLTRLRHQIDISADPVLAALLEEVSAYPLPEGVRRGASAPLPTYDDVVISLQLRSEIGVLSFIGTVTVFGTPVDVTISELAIESFFPADAATAEAMRQMIQADPAAQGAYNERR